MASHRSDYSVSALIQPRYSHTHPTQKSCESMLATKDHFTDVAVPSVGPPLSPPDTASAFLGKRLHSFWLNMAMRFMGPPSWPSSRGRECHGLVEFLPDLPKGSIPDETEASLLGVGSQFDGSLHPRLPASDFVLCVSTKYVIRLTTAPARPGQTLNGPTLPWRCQCESRMRWVWTVDFTFGLHNLLDAGPTKRHLGGVRARRTRLWAFDEVDAQPGARLHSSPRRLRGWRAADWLWHSQWEQATL
jgi:hypothetical protein